MALRSLDNTLPLSPERPKKSIKVANLVSKKAKQAVVPPVNDENVAPMDGVAPVVDAVDYVLSESLEAFSDPDFKIQDLVKRLNLVDAVDYVLSENLEPFSDPDVKIQNLMEGLESKDWLKICESLNDVRRFALFHSALLLPIMEKVLMVLVKSMKNPRSALCKTAIMAAADLFKSYGDKLLESATSDAVDQMMLQLLLKASQDKKFVCEEAERTLKTMVVSTASIPLLHKVKVYAKHGNMRVRAKAAVSIAQCVSKMKVGEMKEYGLVLLIQMSAELLKDRLPEAREAARGMVLLIHKTVIEEEEEEEKQQEMWQSFCQSNLSAIDALAMAKLVASQ